MAYDNTCTCFQNRVYARRRDGRLFRFKSRRLYDTYRSAANDLKNPMWMITRNEFIRQKGDYEAPRWVHSDLLPGMSLLVDRP